MFEYFHNNEGVPSWCDFKNLLFSFTPVVNIYSTANLERVLLGLFRIRNTRNRQYLCSFGSNSVLGMNGISFRSFCSR